MIVLQHKSQHILQSGFLRVALLLVTLGSHSTVQAQPESGLSLDPVIEAGGSSYFAARSISATADGLDLNLGCDLEFRKNPKWGVTLGVVVGRRRYKEKYDFQGVDYELEHLITEIGWRFYLTKTLDASDHGHWVLSFGLSSFPVVGADVTVNNANGDHDNLGTDEAGTTGLRFCVLHKNRTWLGGLVGLGAVVNLQFSGAQRDLHLPWLHHDSLGVGRSRVFVGLVMSIRVAHRPWHGISDG